MAARLRLSLVAVHPGGAWLALAIVLMAGTWLLSAATAHSFDWQPARGHQAWRWWTAAFVHWSPGHRLANATGLALVALLGWRAGLGKDAAAAWLLAWPLTHLGLLARPDLLHYGGLSGVLHAGVVVAAVAMLRRTDVRSRRLGAALLGGLALKLLLERPWGPPLQSSWGWTIALAPAGHLTGSVAGLVSAALWVRRR